MKTTDQNRTNMLTTVQGVLTKHHETSLPSVLSTFDVRPSTYLYDSAVHSTLCLSGLNLATQLLALEVWTFGWVVDSVAAAVVVARPAAASSAEHQSEENHSGKRRVPG